MFVSQINPVKWPRRQQILVLGAGVLVAAGWYLTPLVVDQVEYYTWHR
jgi:hypothetical protein